MGTVAEHVDGVYTGRLVGDLLHGPAKGEAVKALAAREGLDLARCSAYSDSFNDLPMLIAGRATRAPSTRTPGCGRRPRRWAGGSATTAPAARRPGPGSWSGAVGGAVTGAVAAGVAVRSPRH